MPGKLIKYWEEKHKKNNAKNKSQKKFGNKKK